MGHLILLILTLLFFTYLILSWLIRARYEGDYWRDWEFEEMSKKLFDSIKTSKQ